MNIQFIKDIYVDLVDIWNESSETTKVTVKCALAFIFVFFLGAILL